MTVSIKQELCRSCGICREVCPRHIPVAAGEEGLKATVISPERADLCEECGHCAAVCPAGAIQVPYLNGREFDPVGTAGVEDSQLLTLLRQRRSVRRYQDLPIPREEIDRMIDAARCSPTGTGRRATGVIVIDDKENLAALSEHIYTMYEKLEKALANPVARYFIKRQQSEKSLRTLREFVMPGMHWYIRWYREGKSNEILRDCPVLMLFHSHAFEPAAEENCLLAAFHAILMAQSLGIGTCFNGLIPPICNRVQEIRTLLGLPDGHEVYAGITLGYPRYPFRRVVPRDLGEARYLNDSQEHGPGQEM